MNILIYRYNSICEDAVIRGLKELGHTVYEVILEVENKSPSGQEILDAVVIRHFLKLPEYINYCITVG